MEPTGTVERGQPAADWLQPPAEQEGLSRYVETLRERIWVVILTVAITTGVAILYVATATKVYEAEADLLITAEPSDDPTLAGLPLIRESTDPTRAVETASRLITTLDVAERVRDTLDLSDTPEGVLDDVEANPVADSNIVAVTAQGNSPAAARDLANTFAEEAVAFRTDQLRTAIDQKITQLEAQPGDTVNAAAIRRLTELRAGDLPDMLVQTEARAPTSPVSPRTILSIAGGVFGGLVLGIAAAFAFQALDPRLRREEQLRRLYRLPILTRIPREPRGGQRPLAPGALSPAAIEAHRTLRGTLAARRSSSTSGHVMLVTGSTPMEGKTTTSVNLATSLAATGRSVILIEADLRRPAIGETLDVRPQHGIVSVLIESVALVDALVTTSASRPNLGLLLADYEGGWITELFSVPAARELLDEARRLAEYVIIDSPPLTEVVDALPLAGYVDDVLIVARLGRTNLGKLSQLGELLAENGIRPAGFAVVGARRPRRGEYHYAAARDRQLFTGPEMTVADRPKAPTGTGSASPG